MEKRTIYISGTYYFNLLTDSTFKGQIFVPEYKLTSKKMNRIIFDRDTDNEDSLTYEYAIGTDTNGRPLKKDYFFGLIRSKPFFHDMVILVYEQYEGKDGGYGGHFSGKSGRCIVPSASNREEALKILEKHNIFSSEHYK
ncbi:hypothetical protein [Caloranaerobacter sp. DY30410]|uniref:hypothetical protein n=1 Tax=Caloranaerobacter sp. DY30410 TaxID=3238305 RepID=UPI003D046ABF